jgi:hypothetical protein
MQRKEIMIKFVLIAFANYVVVESVARRGYIFLVLLQIISTYNIDCNQFFDFKTDDDFFAF